MPASLSLRRCHFHPATMTVAIVTSLATYGVRYVARRSEPSSWGTGTTPTAAARVTYPLCQYAMTASPQGYSPPGRGEWVHEVDDFMNPRQSRPVRRSVRV